MGNSESNAASAATPSSAAAPTVDQSWDQSHALTDAASAVSHLEERTAEKKDSMKAGEAHAVVDEYALMVAAKTETTVNQKESSVGEKEAAAAQAERAEFATEAAEDHREDAASKIVAAFWASDKSSDITIIVPDGVTMIPDGAFEGCAMTAIVLPKTLTTIGDGAFSGCSFLPEIVLPPTVHTIGFGAFDLCSSLINVRLPYGAKGGGITSFAAEGITKTFYGAGMPDWSIDFTASDAVVVPDGVTMIPDGACSIAMGRVGKLMTSIVFPTSLKSIGDFAFGGCTALPSIVFPPSLKTIGRSAFTGCIALSSIVFSETESLTSIGDYAFSGCTSLPAIVLAPSLETIGSGAFCGCTALAMVEFPDTLTSIGDRAFMKCDSLPAVVLPAYVQMYSAYVFVIIYILCAL